MKNFLIIIFIVLSTITLAQNSNNSLNDTNRITLNKDSVLNNDFSISLSKKVDLNTKNIELVYSSLNKHNSKYRTGTNVLFYGLLLSTVGLISNSVVVSGIGSVIVITGVAIQIDSHKHLKFKLYK